jgi:hypothetical protein
MAKIDLYNFKVTKSIYKIRVNLSEEYRKNGFLVQTEDSELSDIAVIKPKMNFKDTVIECQKGDSDFILIAYKQFPFLHESIIKIGYKGIEDYVVENGFISLVTVKKLFELIYKDLGLQAKAKSTDIKDYFHVKDTDKKIKTDVVEVVDGKEVTKIIWKSNKGYSIIKAKM